MVLHGGPQCMERLPRGYLRQPKGTATVARGRQGRARCRDRTHAGRPTAVQAPLRDGYFPPAPLTSPCAPSGALFPPHRHAGRAPGSGSHWHARPAQNVRLPAPRPRMPAMCTVHRKPGSRNSPPRRRIEGGSWQACSALGRRIPGPRGPRRAHAGGIGRGAGCARSDGSAASQGAGLAASHTPPAPRLPAAHRKRKEPTVAAGEPTNCCSRPR